MPLHRTLVDREQFIEHEVQVWAASRGVTADQLRLQLHRALGAYNRMPQPRPAFWLNIDATSRCVLNLVRVSDDEVIVVFSLLPE